MLNTLYFLETEETGLEAALGDMKLAEAGGGKLEARRFSEESPLKWIRAGTFRERRLVEVTSKRKGTTLLNSIWSQMFLSGTEKLIVGFQHYGYQEGLEGFFISFFCLGLWTGRRMSTRLRR